MKRPLLKLLTVASLMLTFTAFQLQAGTILSSSTFFDTTFPSLTQQPNTAVFSNVINSTTQTIAIPSLDSSCNHLFEYQQDNYSNNFTYFTMLRTPKIDGSNLLDLFTKDSTTDQNIYSINSWNIVEYNGSKNISYQGMTFDPSSDYEQLYVDSNNNIIAVVTDTLNFQKSGIFYFTPQTGPEGKFICQILYPDSTIKVNFQTKTIFSKAIFSGSNDGWNFVRNESYMYVPNSSELDACELGEYISLPLPVNLTIKSIDNCTWNEQTGDLDSLIITGNNGFQYLWEASKWSNLSNPTEIVTTKKPITNTAWNLNVTNNTGLPITFNSFSCDSNFINEFNDSSNQIGKGKTAVFTGISSSPSLNDCFDAVRIVPDISNSVFADKFSGTYLIGTGSVSDAVKQARNILNFNYFKDNGNDFSQAFQNASSQIFVTQNSIGDYDPTINQQTSFLAMHEGPKPFTLSVTSVTFDSNNNPTLNLSVAE